VADEESATMTKTHDRDFFYKYTTASTAKLILNGLTVRWRSPAVFNDPFDTHLTLRFGFEPDEFPEPMARAFEEMIFGDQDPTWEMPHRLELAVRMLRTIRDKLPREEFARQSRAGLDEGMRNATESMRQYREAWPAYVRSMRVFCVAEVENDLLMWSHYADQHRGVVLKLKCIPELDTSLCAARAITYRQDIPVIAGLDEWVAHSTGQRRLNWDGLFFDLVFTKSAHWSYEREWRCWVLARPEDGTELYEDNLLDPEEIEALYLGCRMTKEDREAILGFLGDKLNHVTVFQAQTAERRFGLDFERIR
jgi:hypothetical protein